MATVKETREYQDLKFKTTESLKELDEQITYVRNLQKTVQAKLKSGNLNWAELGDLNRVKVALKEHVFLTNYKSPN